jgi:hypothetical protein
MIEIGKSFQLFQPDRTNSARSGFESKAALQVDTYVFPVTISATPGTSRRMSALVPFHPELGYSLDKRDFTLSTREAKIEAEYDQPPSEEIFHPEAPLALAIDVFSVPLVWREERLAFPEKNAIKDVLFLLSTPSMQVASRPRIWQIVSDRVDFSRFFPTDVGEDLPIHPTKVYYGIGMTRTFVVFLPNDRQKLAQLKGRFLFMKEEQS